MQKFENVIKKKLIYYFSIYLRQEIVSIVQENTWANI